LEEGGADRSYGIDVARLAGLPASVLARAREILRELEGSHTSGGAGLGRDGAHAPHATPPSDQLALFATRESAVERRLRTLDLESMTPLDALNELAALRDLARGT
ncbi:MAG: DNA mismatch repair protein MutS, partial [Longimicrobiales bacterium]